MITQGADRLSSQNTMHTRAQLQLDTLVDSGNANQRATASTFKDIFRYLRFMPSITTISNTFLGLLIGPGTDDFSSVRHRLGKQNLVHFTS